ncbi:MAG: hypothetical protein ACI4U9_00230 [Clostridia bacterium]
MNICFLYGKIVSKVIFEFLYNSKIHTSVVTIEVLPQKEKVPILVKAYDLKADMIYRNFEQGDYISLMGMITSNSVNVIEIESWF